MSSSYVAERLAKLAHDGIEPPASVLRSPAKILLWKALVCGELMHKHLAVQRFGWHLSTAGDAISELHAAGKVHVVDWMRIGDRGPMTKVVAFGPGRDKPHPPKQSNAVVCRRWKSRNYEKALACDRQSRIKRLAREGKLPKGNDPLLRAIMGGEAC